MQVLGSRICLRQAPPSGRVSLALKSCVVLHQFIAARSLLCAVTGPWRGGRARGDALAADARLPLDQLLASSNPRPWPRLGLCASMDHRSHACGE